MSIKTNRKIEAFGDEPGKQFMIDQTHGIVRKPASEPEKGGMVEIASICASIADENSLH